MNLALQYRKTVGDARPGRLLRRAEYVIDQIGERYTDERDREAELSPQPPPEDGKHYVDEVLRLEHTERGFVSVTIEHGGMDTDVLRGHRVYGDTHITLYRFGEEWVEHVNSLYDDLRSKAARAHKARWTDL